MLAQLHAIQIVWIELIQTAANFVQFFFAIHRLLRTEKRKQVLLRFAADARRLDRHLNFAHPGRAAQRQLAQQFYSLNGLRIL